FTRGRRTRGAGSERIWARSKRAEQPRSTKGQCSTSNGIEASRPTLSSVAGTIWGYGLFDYSVGCLNCAFVYLCLRDGCIDLFQNGSFHRSLPLVRMPFLVAAIFAACFVSPGGPQHLCFVVPTGPASAFVRPGVTNSVRQGWQAGQETRAS